jgi:hypothetical protein
VRAWVAVAVLTLAACTGDDSASPPARTTTTPTTAAAPVGFQIGADRSPDDLGRPLPDEGVAIAIQDMGTVLVGLDAHVLGHLPSVSVWQYEDAGPGPFLLRGRAGDYRLDPGARALLPLQDPDEIHFPLAYGTDLVSLTNLAPGDNWLERDGRRVLELGNRMDEGFTISADRDVVTRGRRILDLRTGRGRTVPDACSVGDRHGAVMYLTCYRSPEAEPSIEAWLADGKVKQVVGSVTPAANGVFHGRWTRVFVSPDGNRLLAEWSGECEVARVFLMDADGGRRRDLAEDFELREPDLFAQAWGWTLDGRAIVTVRGEPGCASDQPVSGVYLAGSGRPVLVYPVPDWSRVSGMAVWSPLLGAGVENRPSASG